MKKQLNPVIINMSGNDPGEFTYIKTLPVYWRDDTSGEISDPIYRFICGSADEKDLEKVILYLRYVVFAPCWNLVSSFRDELAELRSQSWKISATVESINLFIMQALEIGIDPL